MKRKTPFWRVMLVFYCMLLVWQLGGHINRAKAETVNLKITTDPVSRLLQISNWGPGDSVSNVLTVNNTGGVPFQYELTSSYTEGDRGLYDLLTLRVESGAGVLYDGPMKDAVNRTLGSLDASGRQQLTFTAGFPLEAGNEFQGKAVTAAFAFVASHDPGGGPGTPTPSGTATPSPTPSGTVTPTPGGTATPSPTPSGTVSPTPSGTVTPKPSPSGTVAPTPTPSTVTDNEEPTPSPTTLTPTGSPKPSLQPSASSSPSASPTPAVTGKPTSTPGGSGKPTPAPTASAGPSTSPSVSPAPTATAASPSAVPPDSPQKPPAPPSGGTGTAVLIMPDTANPWYNWLTASLAVMGLTGYAMWRWRRKREQ
ncbi:hypothetical protein J31TS4_36090 [Paenibacillus sp. J31TS4]|uniref:hypothetical protein n=1 Tax=Paenibacillus sp. J31TS4 TaxID=2807195 RepID=UPI001B1FE34B|nr:hypothetical protein [Paenibacillus sp. J31TS4]GIP40329.1 hypothetical protein J31TS4_36090 [Paenibacillus sp. J31TS4]